MLHHMALVPVELVHFVAELSHTLQVLYFRRPVFKEGCLQVAHHIFEDKLNAWGSGVFTLLYFS